jgi:hypothetical protein
VIPRDEVLKHLARFRSHITYDVLQTGSGWRIQATLARDVSPDDRIKIVEWLHSYRSTVRQQYPFWSTNFGATDQGYFLDINPTVELKEMIGGAVGRALLGLIDHVKQRGLGAVEEHATRP